MDNTIEELTKQLEELKQQRDQYLAGWQRERADLLNYKKDEIERMGQLMRYANEGFLLKVFPILDGLERAEKNIPEDQKQNQVMQGFLQIKSQLDEFLKGQGIEEVETGAHFNPELHESIEEVEVPGKESGQIVEVLEKGYTMGGRLMRPAKVKIAK